MSDDATTGRGAVMTYDTDAGTSADPGRRLTAAPASGRPLVGAARGLALIGLLGLAACGADGEPTPPAMTAVVGLSGNGANAHGAVGLHQGPLSIYLGV